MKQTAIDGIPRFIDDEVLWTKDGTIALLVDKNGKAISNTNQEHHDEITEVNKKVYKAILQYRDSDELKNMN